MLSAVESSHWAALWDLTARHGCPAVSHRSDVSGHSGAAAPWSLLLCPGTDSFPVLLITDMPVGHLSAASTDLHTVGFQQLSGFISAILKESTAAGELPLMSGAVVSCLVLMLHATEKDSSGPDNASMFACTKSSDVDRSSQDSFSTKAPLKESEKPQLLLHCCSTFHYPCLSREFKANSGWWDFHSFSALRSAWLFSSAVQHIEQIFPWKLFITYETEGGDSWAVKS